MTPVVICTLGCKSLNVLETSLMVYNPEVARLVSFIDKPSTFGQSYNEALEKAFKLYDEVIISNDDVVVTPTSISALLEDVDTLKKRHGDKLGFVASLSDDARMSQNIRIERGDEPKERAVVSPIFAWISKWAFETAQFPPLNWYSDDVICEDLNAAGFSHYISRSYVHHVGSQTVGRDYDKLNGEALPWLRANRPEYVKRWWGEAWL